MNFRQFLLFFLALPVTFLIGQETVASVDASAATLVDTNLSTESVSSDSVTNTTSSAPPAPVLGSMDVSS
jgi:hypothetical protein